ncbi:MAG: class I SAM-dependent methyltransferase [Chloroflexota bacterium]|nr:class I SAM-dependent methyltransferase [Chloroflexota bacterium]
MDADGLDALLSADGQELLQTVAREALSTATELALNNRLRRAYSVPMVAAALELTHLRARARAKFDRANQMYFTREGLEQASGQHISAHRARRYASYGFVADLCCGIGGDLVALAPGREALAVDRDPRHLQMAALNAAVYGATAVRTRCEDVRVSDLGGVEAVFVDPARRHGGKRALRESEPPLAWCLGLAERIPAVGIKAAPGLPRECAPPDWELEFVSVRGDLKEAALWSPPLATVQRRATLLPGGDTLVSNPGPMVACLAPGAYLLDPDPAVTRAGLVEELARALGAWKLDPEIAFLSLDAPVPTPFARLLRIEASLPWNLKRLREVLRRLDVGAVDVRKRGSAVDVEELRRRLKLTGNRRVTVALTRVNGKPWAFVCSDP